MGTRADFYIGRGPDAVWLGSIAWDGYPDGITRTSTEREHVMPGVSFSKHLDWPAGAHLFDAATEAQFRERLEMFFENREDVTLPARGWPWPWDNSQTTDYAYAFDGGKVWASCFGCAWFDPSHEEPDHDGSKCAVFPDMSAAAKPAFGGPRSGLIVLGVDGPVE